MVRYFHSLIELDVHQSVRFNYADVSLGPHFLLSKFFVFLFESKVEGCALVFGANEIDL